jgi:hypothetical protein
MQAYAGRESLSVDSAWPAAARTTTWHGSLSHSRKEGKCQVVTKSEEGQMNSM